MYFTSLATARWLAGMVVVVMMLRQIPTAVMHWPTALHIHRLGYELPWLTVSEIKHA